MLDALVLLPAALVLVVALLLFATVHVEVDVRTVLSASFRGPAGRCNAPCFTITCCGMLRLSVPPSCRRRSPTREGVVETDGVLLLPAKVVPALTPLVFAGAVPSTVIDR